MIRQSVGLFLFFCLLTLSLLSVQAAPTANGIIRVSDNLSGSVANGPAYQPDISRNGQYVVYESEATDLINGDTNGVGDIYLYNSATDTISRISEPPGTNEPNGWSREPSISETGLYTAFTSDADNLVSGDTNGFSDIFVYNRVSQQLQLVSVASDGTQADLFSDNPAISANGRFVAFMSAAENLTTLPLPLVNFQVYLHDLDQELTVPVSVNDAGELANTFAGLTGRLAVSDDGMTIAFVSEADNLVPNDNNGVADVFIHRRDPDNNGKPDEPGKIETIRVSVSTLGAEGDGASYDVQMDSDGDLIVFSSDAKNLVSGDTNNHPDVFLHNRVTGVTTRVSVSSSGAQNPGSSVAPDISADGRYITFHANDSTLVNPTCMPFFDCVYRHDRQTGVTELITYQPDGSPSTWHAYQPAISGDGNRIAFLSENGTLDGNTNNSVANAYLWTDPANLTNQVYIPFVVKN